MDDMILIITSMAVIVLLGIVVELIVDFINDKRRKKITALVFQAKAVIFYAD